MNQNAKLGKGKKYHNFTIPLSWDIWQSLLTRLWEGLDRVKFIGRRGLVVYMRFEIELGYLPELRVAWLKKVPEYSRDRNRFPDKLREGKNPWTVGTQVESLNNTDRGRMPNVLRTWGWAAPSFNQLTKLTSWILEHTRQKGRKVGHQV